MKPLRLILLALVLVAGSGCQIDNVTAPACQPGHPMGSGTCQ
jgi:hypothetical protein